MSIPVIAIKATHMKERALKFRTSFINDHLKTNTNYAVSDLLRATSLWPTTAGALKLLLQRRTLTIQNGQITNNIGRGVEAMFAPIVDDQQFAVAVLIPCPVILGATYDDSHLAIQAITAVPVTFITKPNISGAVFLPDSADLLGFAITDTALTYTFAKSGTASASFILAAQFGSDSEGTLIEDVSRMLGRTSQRSGLALEDLQLFSGGVCGGDTNWYVMCLCQEGITLVHQGTSIVERAEILYGPDTQDNCNNWDNQYYSSGFCKCQNS